MAKMRLATIPPVRYLEDFSTDTHLVLAHLYSISVYREFYHFRRALGDFIILDNGCAELGRSIGSDTLLSVARDLKPDVLVCPDVLYDSKATLEAVQRFLPKVDLEVALMGVPQGNSVTDWIECFYAMYRLPELSWIGLSKYSTKVFGSRLECLSWISQSGCTAKRFHLLGLESRPDSILSERYFDFVVSHDTAVPIKLGLQGLHLDTYSNSRRMSDSEYFFVPSINPVQYNTIQRNLRAYRRLCGLEDLSL